MKKSFIPQFEIDKHVNDEKLFKEFLKYEITRIKDSIDVLFIKIRYNAIFIVDLHNKYNIPPDITVSYICKNRPIYEIYKLKRINNMINGSVWHLYNNIINDSVDITSFSNRVVKILNISKYKVIDGDKL